MKKYFSAAVLVTFLIIPCVANAGLTGDTIGMMHKYNSSGVVEYKTVVSGPSDAYEYGKNYTANPEDTSILVDFFNPAAYEAAWSWAPGTFNGLVVTDISASLTGVSVDTNFDKIAVEDPDGGISYAAKTWDPSTMMNFDASSVRFNWSDFVFYDPGEDPYYFNASLTFAQQPVVPEPAALSLFGLGIAGLFKFRKKRV